MSTKVIPSRYENEGMIAYVKRLLSEFPKMGMNQARSIAQGTKRIRCSAYQKHYGKNAAQRNLNHALLGTHGLYLKDGKPAFA